MFYFANEHWKYTQFIIIVSYIIEIFISINDNDNFKHPTIRMYLCIYFRVGFRASFLSSNKMPLVEEERKTIVLLTTNNRKKEKDI